MLSGRIVTPNTAGKYCVEMLDFIFSVFGSFPILISSGILIFFFFLETCIERILSTHSSWKHESVLLFIVEWIPLEVFRLLIWMCLLGSMYSVKQMLPFDVLYQSYLIAFICRPFSRSILKQNSTKTEDTYSIQSHTQQHIAYKI